jgi:hypothetical protein
MATNVAVLLRDQTKIVHGASGAIPRTTREGDLVFARELERLRIGRKKFRQR